jgi:SHS2 domain-containing protein
MYEFLDHPSEELIRVTALSVEEVFSESAMALFELMTDTKTIGYQACFKIDLFNNDRSLLLIDWLNRLILLHEVEHVFLNAFDVQVKSGWRLDGTVTGEKIRNDMERRLHVKSATYGQLQWNETPQGHQVEFVVDV